MEASNVTTFVFLAFLLVAIVVLLVIGTRSIRRTREIQIMRLRLDQLKEIIDWAVEINNCSPIRLTDSKDSSLRQHASNLVAELRFTYVTRTRRGDALGQLVTAFAFGKVLQKSVMDLTNSLSVHVELLDRLRDSDVKVQLAKEIDDHANDIFELALEVMLEANKAISMEIG